MPCLLPTGCSARYTAETTIPSSSTVFNRRTCAAADMPAALPPVPTAM